MIEVKLIVIMITAGKTELQELIKEICIFLFHFTPQMMLIDLCVFL